MSLSRKQKIYGRAKKSRQGKGEQGTVYCFHKVYLYPQLQGIRASSTLIHVGRQNTGSQEDCNLKREKAFEINAYVCLYHVEDLSYERKRKLALHELHRALKQVSHPKHKKTHHHQPLLQRNKRPHRRRKHTTV